MGFVSPAVLAQASITGKLSGVVYGVRRASTKSTYRNEFQESNSVDLLKIR